MSLKFSIIKLKSAKIELKVSKDLIEPIKILDFSEFMQKGPGWN